ncbi:PQQ-like beta-propeller repeat protein [bacterium]|nr:PQQ-like beta-propeller repeat protein [bacterium]
MQIRAGLVWTALWTSTLFAGDWPQFLGPEQNSTADDESIVTTIDKPRPILWKRNVGEGYSGPVVQTGKLILFHLQEGEEVAEAIDVDTGKTVWKLGYRCDYAGGYGTGPGPRATPAIDGKAVFTFGAAGTLQAIDLATGKLLWRRDLAQEYGLPEGFFGVGTSPTVEGDKLLVTVGAKGASLVAFDTATGKTRWNASQDEASYASPIVATIMGKRLGIFFARSGLHLVEIEAGKEVGFLRWRARMNASVNAATPVLVGENIFLSAEYGTGATLVRWTGQTIEPIWKSQDALSCHFNTPVEFDNHLVGIDGRQEGGAQLRCIQAETGEVAWSQPGFGCASLIRVGPTMVAITEEGDLVLFETNTKQFREQGRQKLGGSPTRAHPAISEGVLFVRTPAELLAIDLRP